MGHAKLTSGPIVAPPAQATQEYAACIDVLSKHWYYNKTFPPGRISSVTPGEGINTTIVSWKAMKPLDVFSLKGLPANIVFQGVFGYGTVELNSLWRARNLRIPEMVAVSLYLGLGGVNGSVVGGFDERLIDHGDGVERYVVNRAPVIDRRDRNRQEQRRLTKTLGKG
ncbi:hypothetical protein HOY82DRAFT_595394 [Tuber indicum]|nr:hypothetical protein HOY82DRAFT_595394 [Tuber indicum]